MCCTKSLGYYLISCWGSFPAHIVVGCYGEENNPCHQLYTRGRGGKTKSVHISITYKWFFWLIFYDYNLCICSECQWEMMDATQWSWFGAISWHFRVYSSSLIPLLVMSRFHSVFVQIPPPPPPISHITLLWPLYFFFSFLIWRF